MCVADGPCVPKVGKESPDIGPRAFICFELLVARLFLEVGHDTVSIVKLPMEEHEWPEERVDPQKLVGHEAPE